MHLKSWLKRNKRLITITKDDTICYKEARWRLELAATWMPCVIDVIASDDAIIATW